jgi:hypothetical protein
MRRVVLGEKSTSQEEKAWASTIEAMIDIMQNGGAS